MDWRTGFYPATTGVENRTSAPYHTDVPPIYSYDVLPELQSLDGSKQSVSVIRTPSPSRSLVAKSTPTTSSRAHPYQIIGKSTESSTRRGRASPTQSSSSRANRVRQEERPLEPVPPPINTDVSLSAHNYGLAFELQSLDGPVSSQSRSLVAGSSPTPNFPYSLPSPFLEMNTFHEDLPLSNPMSRPDVTSAPPAVIAPADDLEAGDMAWLDDCLKSPPRSPLVQRTIRSSSKAFQPYASASGSLAKWDKRFRKPVPDINPAEQVALLPADLQPLATHLFASAFVQNNEPEPAADKHDPFYASGLSCRASRFGVFQRKNICLFCSMHVPRKDRLELHIRREHFGYSPPTWRCDGAEGCGDENW